MAAGKVILDTVIVSFVRFTKRSTGELLYECLLWESEQIDPLLCQLASKHKLQAKDIQPVTVDTRTFTFQASVTTEMNVQCPPPTARVPSGLITREKP